MMDDFGRFLSSNIDHKSYSDYLLDTILSQYFFHHVSKLCRWGRTRSCPPASCSPSPAGFSSSSPSSWRCMSRSRQSSRYTRCVVTLHLSWISHSPIYLHDELSDVKNQSPSICRNFWINFLSEHFSPGLQTESFLWMRKHAKWKSVGSRILIFPPAIHSLCRRK